MKSLLEGGSVTRGVSHRHLLTLIGAHASDLEQPMLLYPKSTYGTLKGLLLRSRDNHRGITNVTVCYTCIYCTCTYCMLHGWIKGF